MRNRKTLWAMTALLLTAEIGAAQEKKLPEPAANPAPAATTTSPSNTAAAPQAANGCGATECAREGMTPVPVAPQGPVPGAYYVDVPVNTRKHPLCLWLTYVPARRPYLTGFICQKVPNCQPPLYDYFPCAFDQCHTTTACAPKHKLLDMFHKNQCGPNGCAP
jgi:hypothetical protein